MSHQTVLDAPRFRPSAPPVVRTAAERVVDDFFAGVRQVIDAVESSARTSAARSAGTAAATGGRSREREEKDCGCGCGHQHHEERGHGYRHGHGHGHGRGCDCGCGQADDCCPPACGPDPCACTCCVDDADLVVYGRYGELRMVPVRISNARRRQREITLELSEFRTRGGTPAPVVGQVVPPKLVLDPCEEQTVLIGLLLRPVARDGEDTLTAATFAAAAAAATVDAPDRDVELPDVDTCVTAYADLRIIGCDVRPVRIAVALLPRACEDHQVRCGCGCC